MGPRFEAIACSLIDSGRTSRDRYRSFLAAAVNDSHSGSSFLSSHCILESFVSWGRTPSRAACPCSLGQGVKVRAGEEEDFELLCIGRAF